MSVAVYMRVSTSGQTVASQEKEIRRWLDAEGMVVPKKMWFIDAGVSGKSLKRPAFKALRREIKDGAVDHIVVYGLDRISRNALEGINILGEWLQEGVRVNIITINLDLRGQFGKMVASIMFHLAEIERERLLERQTAGIAASGVKVKRARELAANGVSVPQIAKALDVVPKTVRNMLDPNRKGHFWGGNVPKGQIYKASVETILAWIKDRPDITMEELCKVTDVSMGTILSRMKPHGGLAKVREEARQAKQGNAQEGA